MQECIYCDSEVKTWQLNDDPVKHETYDTVATDLFNLRIEYREVEIPGGYKLVYNTEEY